MSEDFDWTPHLWDEEEVLWQGRPSDKLYVFSWVDLYWAGFVAGTFSWVFSDQSASQVQVPDEIAAIFYPIATILVFAALFWRRLIKDRLMRLRHAYALTTDRALIANTQSGEIERSAKLTLGMNVYESGLAYRYIAFTQKSKALWWLSRGILIDGPPDLLGPSRSASLNFLALQKADRVRDIASGIIERRST